MDLPEEQTETAAEPSHSANLKQTKNANKNAQLGGIKNHFEYRIRSGDMPMSDLRIHLSTTNAVPKFLLIPAVAAVSLVPSHCFCSGQHSQCAIAFITSSSLWRVLSVYTHQSSSSRCPTTIFTAEQGRCSQKSNGTGGRAPATSRPSPIPPPLPYFGNFPPNASSRPEESFIFFFPIPPILG